MATRTLESRRKTRPDLDEGIQMPSPNTGKVVLDKNGRPKVLHPENLKRNFANSTWMSSKYEPKYCDMLVEYMSRVWCEEYVDNGGRTHYHILDFDIPTVNSFALKVLKVNPNTLTNWANKNPEFKTALDSAKEIEKQNLLVGAYSGVLNQKMVEFVLKNNFGMSDKVEQDVTYRFVQQDKTIDDESN